MKSPIVITLRFNESLSDQDQESTHHLSVEKIICWYLHSRLFSSACTEDFEITCDSYSFRKVIKREELQSHHDAPVILKSNGCVIKIYLTYDELAKALTDYFNEFIFRKPHQVEDFDKSYEGLHVGFVPCHQSLDLESGNGIGGNALQPKEEEELCVQRC